MIAAYVINLARSPDRWQLVAETAPGRVNLVRVEGIEGKAVPPAARNDLDAERFRACHGRIVLDGEYGCYRSHLRALRMVADGPDEIALVGEDDIRFRDAVGERVRAIFTAAPDIELLKLVNHRVSGFRERGRSSLGDAYGRCLHGPQGSAACYAVTRAGARKLMASLDMMWLPYDIAFERGWATAVSTWTTAEPLVTLDGFRSPTTIATRDQYRAAKLPRLRQLSTLAFRASDYLARALYALKSS